MCSNFLYPQQSTEAPGRKAPLNGGSPSVSHSSSQAPLSPNSPLRSGHELSPGTASHSGSHDTLSSVEAPAVRHGFNNLSPRSPPRSRRPPAEPPLEPSLSPTAACTPLDYRPPPLAASGAPSAAASHDGDYAQADEVARRRRLQLYAQFSISTRHSS